MSAARRVDIAVLVVGAARVGLANIDAFYTPQNKKNVSQSHSSRRRNAARFHLVLDCVQSDANLQMGISYIGERQHDMADRRALPAAAHWR